MLSGMDPMDEPVTITLTRAEALIAFELFAGVGEQNEIKIRDRADRGSIWSIVAVLEKALSEPFQEDYAARVERARLHVTTQYFQQ